jgi:hypothetical protein
MMVNGLGKNMIDVVPIKVFQRQIKSEEGVTVRDGGLTENGRFFYNDGWHHHSMCLTKNSKQVYCLVNSISNLNSSFKFV